MQNAITDVKGIRVGHYTDPDAATGCTVLLCPPDSVAGVDVRGGAPGTREMGLLSPMCSVNYVHAILLSGGSAFGLAAADGVMKWLEEHDIGFDVNVAKVPIVPAAILFDLAIGSAQVRPTAENAYSACQSAADNSVLQGNIGAGTGATVGKVLGAAQATKGGMGTASTQLENGIVVGALVAVNAVGEVIDPNTQQVVAGPRAQSGERFADSMAILQKTLAQPTAEQLAANTTIGVVATNAKLTKAGATKVAQMTHDGLARTIRPVHTAMDGDTIFAVSTGNIACNPGLLGAVAADVMAEAVLNAIYAAESLHNIPATKDLPFTI